MNYLKLPQLPQTLVFALVVLSFTSDNSLAQAVILARQFPNSSRVQVAQDTPPDEGSPAQTVGGGGNAFPAPPNEGAPGQRKGGAGRGLCPIGEGYEYLTALVPIIQGSSSESETSGTTTSESVFGLTVDEHPTFWFYIPYLLTPKCYAEFTLVEFELEDNELTDNKGKEIYKTTLTDSGNSSGVVGIELPSTAAKLQAGKMYQWKLSYYPGIHNPIAVSGWVQLVELDSSLENQLEQATSLEKAVIYAQAGIWYNALTELAESRIQDPEEEELKTEWEKLLKAVDLEAIAQEPILDFGDQ